MAIAGTLSHQPPLCLLNSRSIFSRHKIRTIYNRAPSVINTLLNTFMDAINLRSLDLLSNRIEMKTIYADISTRFKEIRLNNKLTQKEFWKAVGLSAPAIGAIEQGLYTPNFTVMRLIKQKFNIEYAYLIDGENVETIKNLRQENLRLKKDVARLTKVVDKLTK